MKSTFIKYTALALIALQSVSCGSLLDQDSPVDFSAELAYTTPAGCESAIIGCYSAMRNGALWQGDMIEFLSIASGFHHWRGNRAGNSTYEPLLQQAFAPNYGQNRQLAQFYHAINRCNVLIESMPASSVEQSFKDEVEGEAYLLRAVLYFTLVRMYGDVPLTVRSPKSAAEAAQDLTRSDVIYKQIIDDLNRAWNMMRDPQRQSEVTGTTGRPNKWAAKAFLAKVYVQIGSILGYPDDQPRSFTGLDFSPCGIADARQAWDLALTTAEDVIQNSPYRLANSFGDLFRWTDAADFQLAERIFVMQSTENGSYTNQLCAQRSLPNYVFGSAQNAGSASNNGNYGRYRPSRFIFQKWASTYGGVKAAPGRKDGFDDIYVDCADPRFAVTMYYGSYQYYNNGDKSNVRTQNIYPRDQFVIPASNYGPAWSAPYLKKYLDPKYNNTRGYADFYLLRLADMYLLAAEAAAELSAGPGDAMWNRAFAHVETIHDRARRSVTPAAAYPQWTTGQFSSKQELIDAIFYERIYEFLGEGQEWFDVRRKGAAFMIRNLNKPMNDFNRLPTEGPGYDNANTPVWQKGYAAMYYLGYEYPETVESLRNRLLCALSEEFVNTNPGIDPADPKVNPGW